jgi:hypothetical protein
VFFAIIASVLKKNPDKNPINPKSNKNKNPPGWDFKKYNIFLNPAIYL